MRGDGVGSSCREPCADRVTPGGPAPSRQAPSADEFELPSQSFGTRTQALRAPLTISFSCEKCRASSWRSLLLHGARRHET